MKVKLRKSQARKIEALIEDKRTRHKDVDSFVESAVASAIKAAPKAKPKGRGRKTATGSAKPGKTKRTAKRSRPAPARKPGVAAPTTANPSA